MKVKVTAFSIARGFRMTVGEEVMLVHDPKSDSYQHDPKVIKIYTIDLSKELGTVGKQYGKTVIDGTKNNEFLFDKMQERKLAEENGYMQIKGKVIKEGSVLFRDGSNRRAYVVEVELPKAPDRKLEFLLTVRGSVKEYPGKTAVLKGIQSGGNQNVWLMKESDKIIAFVPDGDERIKAGYIAKAEKGDLYQLESYLDMLAKRNKSQMVSVKEAIGNAYKVGFEIDKETFDDVLDGKIVRSFDEVKKGIIDEGLVDEKTLTEIESYLRTNKVEEINIKEVFESYRPYPDELKSRITKPETLFFDTHGLVKKSIVYLNQGDHLLFIGEKSVGKNILIETLSWIYQQPLFEMATNMDTDKMDFLGSKTIETEIDENGRERTKMSFDPEEIIKSMEVGGLTNIDEFNMAEAGVAALLNPITDTRRRITVPGYGVVKADPRHRLIMSINEDYVGTKPLNEATKSRFVSIRFPNNPSIAKLLTHKLPDADPVKIELADRIYQSIMKLIRDGQLSMDCINIRGFIRAINASRRLDFQETLVDNVANGISDEEYRNTVISVIDDIVG